MREVPEVLQSPMDFSLYQPIYVNLLRIKPPQLTGAGGHGGYELVNHEKALKSKRCIFTVANKN